MGLLFFALMALVAIAEIPLGLLALFGLWKYWRTHERSWLSYGVPALALIALPALLLTLGLLHFLVFGPHGPIHRPEEKDLLGEYYLTEASRRFLLEEKEYPAVPDSVLIILRRDGTLSRINHPDCSFDGFGRVGGRFMSQEESIRAEPFNGLYSWFDGWSLGRVRVYGASPPYRLILTVGDPDSGERLEFERKGR